MIKKKAWGYEDKISGNGKRLMVNDRHSSSIHRHSVDETLLVESGLILLESGPAPDNLASKIFLEENARVKIPAGEWHKFNAIYDSLVIDFCEREDADIERHSAGGKMSDAEYRAMVATYVKQQNQDRVVTVEMAASIITCLRAAGHTVGFCNGCFDLIHMGHLELLRQAKYRCEFLFVGVNTDSSIQEIKGNGRPFVDEVGRFAMIEAIRYVDYVVEVNEKNCVNTIRTLKPDVYITTTEHGTAGPEALMTTSLGGTVEVVDMINGYNTTKIAMSIRGKK